MIRYALAFLGLSAGAGSAQGLVSVTPVLQTCGGTRIVLEAQDAIDEAALQSASDVVSARMGGLYYDVFDYAEVVDGKIVVSIPASPQLDVTEIAGLFDRVEFGFYDVERMFVDGATVAVGNDQRVVPDRTAAELRYLLSATPVLTGADIEDASPIIDHRGHPTVAFQFDYAGASEFGRYTTQNIGKPFAIVSRDEVLSAPTIQSSIWGGSGIITGQFTVEETVQLAAILQGGVLPFDLDVVFQETLNGSDPSAMFCP